MLKKASSLGEQSAVSDPPSDQRPLVLALKESQMLILSPEPTRP